MSSKFSYTKVVPESKKKIVPRKKRDPNTFARKYPWNEWFSKETFEVVQGEHFTCKIRGMVQQIRNNAAKLKRSVSILQSEDSLIVIVRSKK